MFSKNTTSKCYKCGDEMTFVPYKKEVLCDLCALFEVNAIYEKYNIRPGDTVYTLVKTISNKKVIYEVRQYTLTSIKYLNLFRYREPKVFKGNIENNLQISLGTPTKKYSIKRYSMQQIYPTKDLCVENNKKLIVSKILKSAIYNVSDEIKDDLYNKIEHTGDLDTIQNIVNTYLNNIQNKLF